MTAKEKQIIIDAIAETKEGLAPAGWLFAESLSMKLDRNLKLTCFYSAHRELEHKNARESK